MKTCRQLTTLVIFGILQFYSQASSSTGKENLLVFIHGFKGSSLTWNNESTKSYWPNLVKEDNDLRNFDTTAYTYTAGFFVKGYTTPNHAKQLLLWLSIVSQQYEEIYIIAHSYGGVLSVEMLRLLDKSENDVDKTLFRKVKAILLISSPLKGIKQIEKVAPFIFPSLLIGDLKYEGINSYLQNLNIDLRAIIAKREFKNNGYPLIYSSYETRKTVVGKIFPLQIVDYEDIWQYPDDITDPHPFDEDHYSICKPADLNSPIHWWVKKKLIPLSQGYTPQLINFLEPLEIDTDIYFDTQSNYWFKIDPNLFEKKKLSHIKIFTEIPYAQYRCFDYVNFVQLQSDKGTIVFTNKPFEPDARFTFRFDKKSCNITFYWQDLDYSTSSKRASFVNYLDFLKFRRAIIGNARIVFWDLERDAVLFRTGHALATNLNLDYPDYLDKRIEFLKKLVRIEKYFGLRFPFQTLLDSLTLKKILYINDALDRRSIIYVGEYNIELKNLEEKKLFLKNFHFADYADTSKVKYYQEKEKIELLDEVIDLGPSSTSFPDIIMEPSLEIIAKDITDDPVIVKIKTKGPNEKIIHAIHTASSREFVPD